MINFFKKTVKFAAAIPIALSFAIGAAQAEKIKIIGSPPTVVNAVVDALRSANHNVTHIDMPLTPERVWAAMNN